MSKSEKSIQKTVQMEVTTRTQRTWFSVRRSEEYLQDSLIPICNLIPRTMPWVKQVLDNHLLNEFLKCCKLRKKKKRKERQGKGARPNTPPLRPSPHFPNECHTPLVHFLFKPKVFFEHLLLCKEVLTRIQNYFKTVVPQFKQLSIWQEK